MKTSKFLPAGFAALVMIGAGAMVATAQSAPDQPAPDQAAPEQSAPEQAAPRQPGADKAHGPMEGKRFHRAHFRPDHGKHPRFGPGKGGEIFRDVFEAADADKDGTVTREELDAYRADRVSAVDADGDGALSIEEFDTLYRELTRSRMVDAFQSLDHDGDGVISAEEMDKRVNRMVERLDHDGDGALSLKRGPKGR